MSTKDDENPTSLEQLYDNDNSNDLQEANTGNRPSSNNSERYKKSLRRKAKRNQRNKEYRRKRKAIIRAYKKVMRKNERDLLGSENNNFEDENETMEMLHCKDLSRENTITDFTKHIVALFIRVEGITVNDASKQQRFFTMIMEETLLLERRIPRAFEFGNAVDTILANERNRNEAWKWIRSVLRHNCLDKFITIYIENIDGNIEGTLKQMMLNTFKNCFWRSIIYLQRFYTSTVRLTSSMSEGEDYSDELNVIRRRNLNVSSLSNELEDLNLNMLNSSQENINAISLSKRSTPISLNDLYGEVYDPIVDIMLEEVNRAGPYSFFSIWDDCKEGYQKNEYVAEITSLSENNGDYPIFNMWDSPLVGMFHHNRSDNSNSSFFTFRYQQKSHESALKNYKPYLLWRSPDIAQQFWLESQNSREERENSLIPLNYTGRPEFTNQRRFEQFNDITTIFGSMRLENRSNESSSDVDLPNYSEFGEHNGFQNSRTREGPRIIPGNTFYHSIYSPFEIVTPGQKTTKRYWNAFLNQYTENKYTRSQTDTNTSGSVKTRRVRIVDDNTKVFTDASNTFKTIEPLVIENDRLRHFSKKPDGRLYYKTEEILIYNHELDMPGDKYIFHPKFRVSQINVATQTDESSELMEEEKDWTKIELSILCESDVMKDHRHVGLIGALNLVNTNNFRLEL